MSKNLSERRHKSFHSDIKGLLQNMAMCSSNDSDTLSPQNFSLNNIVSTLKDNYINKWRSKLENSEKLIFYKDIKTKYEPEGYLSSQTNIFRRKELTKLQISNHELVIEKGR